MTSALSIQKQKAKGLGGALRESLPAAMSVARCLFPQEGKAVPYSVFSSRTVPWWGGAHPQGCHLSGAVPLEPTHVFCSHAALYYSRLASWKAVYHGR